jgi:hypothetical protein
VSYDVDLVIDAGGPEPAVLCDASYHGVGLRMWRLVLPETGLDGMNGMPAAQAAEQLAAGIARMEDDPGQSRSLTQIFEIESDQLEDLFEDLKTWLAWCQAHPKATFRVSK